MDDSRKFPFRSTFNSWVTIPGIIVILAVVIACAAFPGSSGYYLNEAKQWITKSWGWLFILGVSCFVIFLLLLCVSKLGDIRLGDDDEEPEYPFLSWIAMLFAAGMGIGLMYFGVAEPISHYALPLDPNLSQGARAETAMLNTFFHWGIHAWAIYGVLGLALAYFGFRYHLPLTVRSGFYPLLKNRLDGALGRIIDITALCCTIFGITTTLGFGALQLGAGLKQIGFISHIDMPQLIVIITVSISFSILSAISGVGKGVRHLSEINLLLALGLLLFVLLAGPSMMIMSDFTQNLGEYIHNIIPLSFGTFAYDPENEGWFTSWTVVYWAWWIAWAPFVGMFIAKISRGRTIREFVLGVLFVPTLFNLLWMTIFGNSAIWVDLQTNGSLSAISGETEALLFAFLNHLPLGSVTSFISVVIIALFFVTSADSGIFVINTIASYGKSGFPKWQSIFWGASLALLAIVLLYSGGLGALQAMTMVMALPFLVVMIVLCFCLWDGLLVDNGYFSRGLSVCTSYWTGSLWKERLHSMSRKPDLVNARKFIREVAVPAFEELADEMKKYGVEATVEYDSESLLPKAEFIIKQDSIRNFKYGIDCEIHNVSDFAIKNDSMPQVDSEVVYVPMSYFEDGRTGYPVRYMKKDEIIVDILRQYDRFTKLVSDKKHKLFIFDTED